jgi:hypothetical protein
MAKMTMIAKKPMSLSIAWMILGNLTRSLAKYG